MTLEEHVKRAELFEKKTEVWATAIIQILLRVLVVFIGACAVVGSGVYAYRLFLAPLFK